MVDKGITVAGKPLRDHLEAVDHHEAVLYVRDLARRPQPLSEPDVRQLHGLVVRRSDPVIAGRHADLPRFVRTDAGRHAFPSPAEVPARMGDLGAWLQSAAPTCETAFTAHRRLVDVHPFDDGNGRTARLLMNLFRIRGGYPPVAIRSADRLAYVRALAAAQAGEGQSDYEVLMYERLAATQDDYLAAFKEALGG